jgi:GT2 family glycosyltransferase
MLLSVVIPTYSRGDLLLRAIDSIQVQTIREHIEIIVVDNASPRRLDRLVQEAYGDLVKVIRLPRNLFYCGAINAGSVVAVGSNIGVLNDDCWIEADWAENVLKVLDECPTAAGVASLVFHGDSLHVIDSAGDELHASGRATNRYWRALAPDVDLSRKEVFSAAGSCAVYRSSAFREVAGFDENFVGYLEDVDIAFRLRLRGYGIVFDPACRAHHRGGGTPKTRYYAAFLLERNMVWNLIKNMPREVILANWWTMLSAQLRPAPLVGGRVPLAWLTGKLAALIGLPPTLKKRRKIQAGRVSGEVAAMLWAGPIDTCHL